MRVIRLGYIIDVAYKFTKTIIGFSKVWNTLEERWFVAVLILLSTTINQTIYSTENLKQWDF